MQTTSPKITGLVRFSTGRNLLSLLSTTLPATPTSPPWDGSESKRPTRSREALRFRPQSQPPAR